LFQMTVYCGVTGVLHEIASDLTAENPRGAFTPLGKCRRMNDLTLRHSLKERPTRYASINAVIELYASVFVFSAFFIRTRESRGS
jgi:hypothetical protein